MGKPNPQNLNPCNSENARERQLKSAQKRKENNKLKKIISQLYIETLEKSYDVKQGESIRRKKGYKILGQVIMKILQRGDSSSVAMIRELREATEGSKMEVTGNVTAKLESTEERLKAFEELMK